MERAAQAVLDARAQFMGEGARASARFNVESSSGSHSTGTPSPVPAVKRPEGRAPGSTLADLYDPVAMPPSLSKAHTELDRAVDRCYRKEPFPSDRARVEYLFQLYEQLSAPLSAAANAKPKRAIRKPAYAKSPSAPVDPSLTPEKSYGDAAHYYSGKEDSPPYRTSTNNQTKGD